MTSKKRLFLLGIALFIVMGISGIYSLQNEVINKTETSISTSGVDIELVEDETPDTTVMPGEIVTLNPRVNNLGEDCYIRTKMTFTVAGNNYDVEDYIDIDTSKWTKNGNYYYYNGTVAKEGTANIFKDLTIPQLNNSDSNKQAILNIVVEAIQSKNLTVDNASNDPWHGIEIKESVEREYTGIDGSSTVIYENGANKGLDVPDNFFNNLNDLMPGDSKEQTVQINNSSKNKNNYLISVETEDLNDEEKALLGKVKLTVTDQDGNIVIEDTLDNINNISMGTYPSGKSGTLTFKVTLPTDADNTYSKIGTKITWKFSLISEAPPDTPDTGDFRLNIALKAFILSSIGFIIVLILYKKRQDEEEKKEGKI